MSNQGIFHLVHNTRTNELNSLLTARELLCKRLTKLHKSGKRFSYRDILQSHYFYLDSCFKPMVPIGQDYVKEPSIGKAKFGTTVKFTNSQNSDFIHDQFIHVRISAIGSETGTTKYRYCPKPGLRLLKSVRLSSPDPIDEYGPIEAMFYDKFLVGADKRKGWNRCIGEDNGVTGTLYHEDSQTNECTVIKAGAQTLKTYQPALDMFIPLLFWYNLNASKALPRNAFNALQTNIHVAIADLSKIVRAEDENGNEVSLPSNVCIEKFELYTNSLFTEQIISELYYKNMGFQLITLHRLFRQELSSSIDSILLKGQLRFPVENLQFCFMPKENETSVDDWCECCYIQNNCICVPVTLNRPAGAPANQGRQLAVRCMHYKTKTAPIDTIEITSSSTDLIDERPAKIFSHYFPWHYDERKSLVKTPEDECAYMYSFGLFPYYEHLNGFINMSVGREMYLSYKSSQIDIDNPAILYIMAHTYNFLLIENNKIILKFAT